MPWQGIELEDLPALEATCSCATASGLSLHFRCQQLLTGPAGDALLRRLQPSLAGRGAAVNVGSMRVALPPEAAAALLPTSAFPPLAAQQRQRSLGTAAGTPPQQEQQAQQAQQRGYTGRGSGGGRVVVDCEEDW